MYDKSKKENWRTLQIPSIMAKYISQNEILCLSAEKASLLSEKLNVFWLSIKERSNQPEKGKNIAHFMREVAENLNQSIVWQMIKVRK